MKMGPISREPGLFTLNRQRKGWRLKEPVLWGVPLAMVMVAGLLIASTQRQADYADWYHHWITAAVGVVIALVTARLPLLRLKPLLIPIYAITVISLVAVRLIGTTALGAQRWLSIGGVHVQPSEFAKLSAILLLAAVLDRHPVERPVDLLRPLGIISIPWLLVFIQPDLGTSLVFGALLLTMLYWSGMPIEWLVLLLSPLNGCWIPLHKHYELNEQHSGMLTGKNKRELAREHGEDTVMGWRREFDQMPPPLDDESPLQRAFREDERYAATTVPGAESLRSVCARVPGYAWTRLVSPGRLWTFRSCQ